jgi:hypothetical protein
VEELAERHRRLSGVDAESMRREADKFFGTDDRVDDDDLCGRDRGRV